MGIKLWKMVRSFHNYKYSGRCPTSAVRLAETRYNYHFLSLSGESLMYPVLGMRGGYSLDLDHDDNTVLLVGWSRAEGEQEVRHTISSTGQVTDLTNIGLE